MKIVETRFGKNSLSGHADFLPKKKQVWAFETG
jgi:hypothetical protein